MYSCCQKYMYLNNMKTFFSQIKLTEGIVGEADEKTGEAKCAYYRAKITFLFDEEVSL